MPRPIELVIRRDALRHNFSQMKKAAGERKVWVVVKANAYGHGLENALEAFRDADGIAILDISAAAKARAAGWKKRILVIEGFFDKEDIPAMEASGTEVLIHSERVLRILEEAGAEHLCVHIATNTGMSRLGFRPSEVEAVKQRLECIPGVIYKGIVTHLANGDPSYSGNGPATVAKQLERLDVLKKTGGELCIAATTGMLFHPEVRGDAVRAGIALYGVSPDSTVSEEKLGLIPAQTLRARIIAVQNVHPGEAVGYGSKWTAERESRIGIVACGYADGYPRIVPNGTPVWLEKERKEAPVSGRVCMDMIFIDLTDFPETGEDDWVELWGEHLHVNRIAEAAGTIGYELVCGIMPRVPVRSVN